jgi:tryptophan synthase alpha chain
MTRITQTFQKLERPVFIPYIVAGDPDCKSFVDIAKTVIDAGADILEVGVPFSDPVADGPTIQRANERALKSRMTPDRLFTSIRELRRYSGVPIVLLTYYNIVYRRGIERFYRDASLSGVDGILIVDMPAEESVMVLPVAQRHGIDQIFLIAPTTSEERILLTLRNSSGFLYLVSRLGVTGIQADLPQYALDQIERVRSHTNLPLAIGFGISTPDHVRSLVSAGVDAVIVGSAIVNIIEKNLNNPTMMKRELRRYIMEMHTAMNQVSAE